MTHTAPGDSPSAESGRLPAAAGGAVFLALVLAIGALSLLLPRRFVLFGIDHLSFLPAAFRAAWTLAAAAAVWAAGRWDWRRLPRPVLIAVAAVFLLTLPVFRTTFPVLHGDGEVGAAPLTETAPSLRSYPGIDGRLQSFLAYGLYRVAPSGLRFRWHHCGYGQKPLLNNAWILVVLLAGALVVLAAAWSAVRCRQSGAARLGLLLLVAASPGMANAYGHFDSYILPVLFACLWSIAVYGAYRSERWARPAAAVAAATALAAWSHPLMIYLALYAVLLPLFLRYREWTGRVHAVIPAAFGLLAAMTPYLPGRGNADLFDPANAGVLGWMIHEKAMSAVQVSLPALALAVGVLALDPRLRRGRTPLQSLGLVMLSSSLGLCVTVWMGYGLRDEFVYSMFGSTALAGAVFLFLESGADRRLALQAGLLSVFLFVPRIWVYSGSRLLDRWEAYLPLDRSAMNRRISPYHLLSLVYPIEDDAWHQRRLAVLEKGFTDPPPFLDGSREQTLASYVCWSLELGREEDGVLQLSWLIDNHSRFLPLVWGSRGHFHTTRYRNAAPVLARRYSQAIIAQRLEEKPGDPLLTRMQAYLEALNRVDPLRLPHGLGPARPDGFPR